MDKCESSDGNDKKRIGFADEPSSLSSLIVWNISKALEKNHRIDLKCAIKAAQERMEKDVDPMVYQYPEERHLACALLAWQQLGHNSADSLYKFVEDEQIERTWKKNNQMKSVAIDKNLKSSCCDISRGLETYSKGPVIKIPTSAKLNIVMRLDSGHQNPRRKQQKEPDKKEDPINKIDAACCMDSECAERLTLLDAATTELRERANKLARREAERVELLERAETAWKDLELGYQRRLTNAEEKEDDMTKEIAKLIEDRNAYKSACTALVQELAVRGEAAEKDKDVLVDIERQVCEHACVKMRSCDESSRAEATLAEHECRAAQLDRDLQFKEEQVRRKKLNLETEQESARALSIEAERTMRSELITLREQIKQVSHNLLKEDEENGRIKGELDKLRQEKMEIVEDLEGCKESCDAKMQGKLNELKKKRDKLAELRDTAMECRCKLPVDETVEVKRTPSLAALCRCTPEDRLVESCSCTSLRERLLSNLLADLFAGLQAELGGSGVQMPCQLLKCLEDKHNWDKASLIKTNLRNFFSKLLIGELDIAIATSIEKYHAKWVGASCADDVKRTSVINDPNEGWEERAIERKAQKMATKLAEQLFHERADQLTERAKEIVKAGPPPCECKPAQAFFPCLIKTTMPNDKVTPIMNTTPNDDNSELWKCTQMDFTQLKLQIEALKKDSIKKEDLRKMEQKITKIVQQATGADKKGLVTSVKDISDQIAECKKEKNSNELRFNTQNKIGTIKKKTLETSLSKKGTKSQLNQISLIEKNSRQYKRVGPPAYAVNLCLCGPKKESNIKTQQSKLQRDITINSQNFNTWKQKFSKDNISQISCIKQTKPIDINLPNTSRMDFGNSKLSSQPNCPSDCICFHKKPSNTSIDKFLETLVQWKCDLIETENKYTMKSNSSPNYDTLKYRVENQNIIKDQMKSILNMEMSKKNILINNTKVKYSKDELDHILPVTTESEYIGAVNLDKSTEKVCNCIKLDTNENNIKPNNLQNSNIFKCINSDACNCKISSEIEIEKSKSQTEIDKPKDILNLTQNGKVKYNDLIENEEDPVVYQNEENLVFEDNSISKKTDIFPNDYCVKFLGVTLTNANSLELSKSLDQNDDCVQEHILRSRNKKNTDNIRNQSESRIKRLKGLNKLDDTLDKTSKQRKNNNKQTKSSGPLYNESNHVSYVPSNHKLSDINMNESSIKMLKRTQESCVCCNGSNIDDAKDIEVNLFHLLEEHLKGKIEEFKMISCKSSCIQSCEEEKIFTDILQKVKQVISDCANEMKCKCPGEYATNDGRWNRAYGLLQEYLKIKIQRVQCLCVSLNDSKNIALAKILDKVCNLIEHDFERLKDICKCKNTQEARKHVPIEKQVKHIEEVPEKDINNSEYEIVLKKTDPYTNKISNHNSIKSIIFRENISSQVPPNLGMQTKSCDAMSTKTKDIQTTETETIYPYEYLYPKKINKVVCDCYCNTINQNNGPFLELFGTKEVMVSLCGDTTKNVDHINLPINTLDSGSLHLKNLECIPKNLHDIDLKDTTIIKTDTQAIELQNKRSFNLPYVGYTVDCACERSLGSCFCTKSIVQANNNKIKQIWNSFIARKCNLKQNVSYIMNNTQNTINNEVIINAPVPMLIEVDNKCETEINALNEEEVFLLESKDKVDITNNMTNTLEGSVSLSTEYSNSDWIECSQVFKPEIRSTKGILKDPVYFPLPPDYIKKFKSETQVDTVHVSNSKQKCDCNVVPICHVKMLVENIEKKLMNSKCTCDSMLSKVCPVHSERI